MVTLLAQGAARDKLVALGWSADAEMNLWFRAILGRER
jgi:hypothetical protein